MKIRPKLIGIDIGERRIGLAVSDDLWLTAQPRGVYHRSGEAKDIDYLVALAREEGAVAFVAGLPKRTTGEEGPEAAKVRAFTRKLEEKSGLPVRFADERFTTVIAHNLLLAADTSRERRRQVVDKLAAALILQTFLDTHRDRATEWEKT
ncbi:MAG TPA: Holliday junction resolvase RuvX [Firmicutes bacterium]|nr:Holliday junction resolvase RuvX [Bacillota bacterium]